MATVGKINVLFTTDASPIKKGAGQAAMAIQAFEAATNKASSTLNGLFAAAAGALTVGAFYKMAGAAAHAEEAVNKIGAVFGDEAPRIETLSRDMAKAYGLSLNEMLDATGRIGSMFQGAGFDSEAVAEYSDSMARLANDLSRFNDTSFETAFQKLRSGLAGESEPLRDFGIFLTEASVKAKAYEMGIARMGEELTDAQKIQARANIILEKSGPAIGAAAREADGASSKFEAFWGSLENLQITIGERFAPVFASVLDALSQGIAVMGNLWGDASDRAVGFSDAVVDAANGGLSPLQALAGGTEAVANAAQKASIGFKGMGIIGTSAFAWLIKGTAKFLEGVGAAQEFFNVGDDTTRWAAKAGNQLADEMFREVEALNADFAEAFNAKPWGDQVVAEFEKVGKGAAELRAKLAAEPIQFGDVGAGDGAKSAAKANAKLFGEALTFGSSGAVSAVLRNRYGDPKRNNDVAANTKRSADGIDKLVVAANKLVGGVAGLGNLAVAEI